VRLAAADRFAASGAFAEAAKLYARILDATPRNWPERPRALVARIAALSKIGDIMGCLTLANATLNSDGLGNGVAASDFASRALQCADHAPQTLALVVKVRRRVAERLQKACDGKNVELSPDDRADACDNLSAAYASLGEPEKASAASAKRLEVLEAAAAGKPDDVALTYDWARTEALIDLKRLDEALALSVARERALPDNYNPPHYQAKVYRAMGRFQDGLRAIERALQLAYGPRKIALLTLKADLLLGAGRNAEAKRVVETQLAEYRALPQGQKQPAAEERVQERLESWR
jgi:tetratricopeptide (TPR) repeat protein